MSSVAAHYQHRVQQGEIEADPAQQSALEALDRLAGELQGRAAQQQRWWSRWSPTPAGGPPRGVYLWGGVGRGKTFLMDLFFDALPADGKHKRCLFRLV